MAVRQDSIEVTSTDETLHNFVDRVFEEHYEEQTGERSGCRPFWFECSVDGAVVGAIEGDYWFGGCTLSRVAVKKEWRKSGVGTALMRHVLSYCRSLGARACVLHTFDYQAPDWYPKFGFVLQSTRENWGGRTAYYYAAQLDAIDPQWTSLAHPEEGVSTVRAPASAAGEVSLVTVSIRLVPHPTAPEKAAEMALHFRSTFDGHSITATGRTSAYFPWAFQATVDVDTWRTVAQAQTEAQAQREVMPEEGDMAEGGRVRVGVVEGKSYWHGIVVSHLVVDKRFRGVGLARRLMDAVRALAASKGSTLIAVETMSFQCPQLYSTLGFIEDAVVPGWEQDAKLHFYVQHLPASPAAAEHLPA